MRYHQYGPNQLPKLLLNLEDLRNVQELTRNVMVPKTVQGFTIDAYKYVAALRAYFIGYGLSAPYEVDLAIYPGDPERPQGLGE